MFTPAMHGPVAVTLFWIWLGFVAAGVGIYWLWRTRRNKAKKKEMERAPAKYANQLRQRMQKKRQPAATPPGEHSDARRKS